MNYQRLYEAIILRAKLREKPQCYCEKHHIVPRSMGGDDSSENIAVLTAREHFLAHWLLYKIHRNKAMSFAFWKMTHPVGNGRVRYTSRSFMYARRVFAKTISEHQSGENHPFYGKTGKDSPTFGTKRTDASKELLRQAAYRRVAKGIIPRSRKVINMTTGEVYRSVNEAQKAVSKGNVLYAIRSGGTADGDKFAYLDKNGIPDPVECTLRGYAKGERHHLSRRVVHVSSRAEYPSASSAGRAFSMTGAAVLISIREGRSTKKGRFEYV